MLIVLILYAHYLMFIVLILWFFVHVLMHIPVKIYSSEMGTG